MSKEIWVAREFTFPVMQLDGSYRSFPGERGYYIVDQDKIIAAQIPDKKTAEYIVWLHTLEGAMIELVDTLIEQQEALEYLGEHTPLAADVAQDEVEKIVRKIAVPIKRIQSLRDWRQEDEEKL